MNPEIIRLACSLTEAETEAKLAHQEYKAALKRQDDVRERLSLALYEQKFPDALAINLDDNEVLVCIWDGSSSYDFSLIRSFS
jgi:hypothetical protein